LRALPHVLTVGWLEPPHHYQTGPLAPHLLEKLKLLVTHEVNVMRGSHQCPICRKDWMHIDVAGCRYLLGHGEIWIPDGANPSLVYAAPTLVVHYVEAHSYLPPAAFLESLDRLDLTLWRPEQECDRALSV